MKLFVAAKQVATVDNDFESAEVRAGVDPSYLEYELNEWDACALEAAAQIARTAATNTNQSRERSSNCVAPASTPQRQSTSDQELAD